MPNPRGVLPRDASARTSVRGPVAASRRRPDVVGRAATCRRTGRSGARRSRPAVRVRRLCPPGSAGPSGFGSFPPRTQAATVTFSRWDVDVPAAGEKRSARARARATRSGGGAGVARRLWRAGDEDLIQARSARARTVRRVSAIMARRTLLALGSAHVPADGRKTRPAPLRRRRRWAGGRCRRCSSRPARGVRPATTSGRDRRRGRGEAQGAGPVAGRRRTRYTEPTAALRGVDPFTA